MSRLIMLLIDWLTLRLKLSRHMHTSLYERVMSCRGLLQCYKSDGVLDWEKHTLDIDALRSDTVGLLWQVQSDGKDDYLVIGGSPASIRNGGVNVFGDLDIIAGAEALIAVARKALAVILPGVLSWQCRRIDITGNYALPDKESVKQGLRQLMHSDSARRKASNAKSGGDTVVWAPTSDISKGKAYHKGPQLTYLRKRGQIEISDDDIAAADRLLRLEHTRGSRWWRRFEEDGGHFTDLGPDRLEQLYRDFFGPLVQGLEVKDMDRYELVKLLRDANDISQGRAEAAYTTLRNIRQDGWEVVRGYMPRSTWGLHLKYLRRAGITDADMITAQAQAAVVIPMRPVRIVLAEPVSSWDQLRRVA